MKKVKSLVLGLVLILALTACSNKADGNKPKAKASFEQNGVKIEMFFYAEDDKINTIEQVSTLDMAKYDENQKKVIEETSKAAQEAYKAIKGVEYKTESKDTTMIETITMNVGDETTLKALVAANLLPTTSKDVSTLSLKATIESLKSKGFNVEELK